MFPRPIQTASPGARALYRVALPVSLIIWLLPLLAIFLTSARTAQDLAQGNYWGWPHGTNLFGNYAAVFTSSPMGRYLLNSIEITLPAVAGTLVLSTLAGFGLAKFRFRASSFVLAIFIAGNFVPFQILMIPVRDLMIHVFPLYNTIWALIVFHSAFQTGFCTLFMRNFMREIPDSLLEAARMDGAGSFRIFWLIVLPLVRPALAALAVLEFTFIWNDYFWALVLVQSDSARPITAGLQALQGMWLASWQLMSAGAIVAATPSVVVFFLMQRHFISGLTLGSVKE
ncbi:carbohydrate ABC transporter permease [Lichenicola cladoniae]|uniref:sn-glycerol-3-phosphate transport system permease protein UgpE n=1 Tax=Lichenicola cladoniae TaxID=1484109 RepID=A0A6M8HTT2_9PROT|nr:carbohydrate ABC transporter permease [Lichenicola cladoniae]NPD67689.1 carbohydrate ABC transporter permease [Acetobacteraceae bacterium]QKE91625.1 carbohydrate ABC transporter permease [Lichenicola cladoniae]